MEIWRRWNDAALRLVRDLARIKERESPGALHASVQNALQHRWWAILSVSAQLAVADTLMDTPQVEGAGEDITLPSLVDLIHDAAYMEGLTISPLPGER